MVNFRFKFTRSRRRHSTTVGDNVRMQLLSTADSRDDSTSQGRSEHDEASFERGSSGSRTPTFRIQIPFDVESGTEFNAYAGDRIVRVRCPQDSQPGEYLQISVPAKVDSNDSASSDRDSTTSQELPQDSENVTRMQSHSLGPGEQAAHYVQIPEGVSAGEHFPVRINGQHLSVVCPNMGRAGMSVKVVPPNPPRSTRSPIATPNMKRPDGTRRFEAVVPKGVEPGKPFALFAEGVRVLVNCPQNASSGQKIQFDLPLELVKPKTNGTESKLAKIKLSYDKDGWTRIIRATDMKFQWTRFDDKGNVDVRKRFDTNRSAYVLKLEYLDDERIRQGCVSLVTPESGVVDSNIKTADGSELASYSDIANAQTKSYGDKINWFKNKCSQLAINRNTRDFIQMNIRRDYLMTDSIGAVMNLTREEMRQQWRFHFIGEDGLDVGGLKREWFELVTKAMFDPNMGLWQSSSSNQMCMQINPASAMCCPEDHLMCFRFIGRVMGKAMFDGELVRGHMVNHLYKHLLGWPVMFNDLKELCEDQFNSLKGLNCMGADVQYVGVDFTTTEDLLGTKQSVELIPGGAKMILTETNLPEYIEARLRYHLMGQHEAQLNELLLGFYDVLPKSLLTIFDFQELELLMCGLPKIEMRDWMEYTEYSGEYDRDKQNHKVCVWFWDIVSDYDQEMKARLLQFVTGTSGVPAHGFSSLQGNDDNVRRFTIQGVDLETCIYPRSHTCFNRIDLPLYETRDELEDKLRIAVTMAATGFDIE